MDSLTLRVEREGAVATVMLDRPDHRNALDETLISALADAFTHLSEDPAVRVVVLAGAGPVFCAGADLAWMARAADMSPEENRIDARTLQRMLSAVEECPKATVARVQGAGIGGGAGLVAACDVAIAAGDAVFAFSEVRLGLAPSIIAHSVVAKIGPGAARALFVSGERFGAAEALRLGLVQKVVPGNDLDATVRQTVEGLLQCGPEAIAAIKRLLRDLSGRISAATDDLTVDCIATMRASPEGREGVRAFLEKRRPDYAL